MLAGTNNTHIIRCRLPITSNVCSIKGTDKAYFMGRQQERPCAVTIQNFTDGSVFIFHTQNPPAEQSGPDESRHQVLVCCSMTRWTSPDGSASEGPPRRWNRAVPESLVIELRGAKSARTEKSDLSAKLEMWLRPEPQRWGIRPTNPRPNTVILLRVLRRRLAFCEHKPV